MLAWFFTSTSSYISNPSKTICAPCHSFQLNMKLASLSTTLALFTTLAYAAVVNPNIHLKTPRAADVTTPTLIPSPLDILSREANSELEGTLPHSSYASLR